MLDMLLDIRRFFGSISRMKMDVKRCKELRSLDLGSRGTAFAVFAFGARCGTCRIENHK